MGWMRALDLERWADELDSRHRLPQLMRRLVHATVGRPERVEFPAFEGVQRPGFDGVVIAPEGNA